MLVIPKALRFSYDRSTVPAIRADDVAKSVSALTLVGRELSWKESDAQGNLVSKSITLPEGGGGQTSTTLQGITLLGDANLSWAAPNNNNWQRTGITIPSAADKRFMMIEFHKGLIKWFKTSDLLALTATASLTSGGGIPPQGTYFHCDDVVGNFGFYIGRSATNEILVRRDSSAFALAEEISFWQVGDISAGGGGYSNTTAS